MARTCRRDDCDEEVRGRRRYCSDECAHEARRDSRVMNWMQHGDRYNANRRKSRAQGERIEEPDEDVVDFSKGGGPPPRFDIAQRPHRDSREDQVIDFTKGAPGLGYRAPQLDYSRVPAWVRHDQERARRMAAQQAQDEPDQMTWDSMMANARPDGTVVNFSRPAVDMSGGLRGERIQRTISNPAVLGIAFGAGPDYRAAAAGQAVRAVQPPPPNRSGQRLPHIIP